jgi:deazaflavin-dependent oxidoreductase (nitroreductase family)
MSMADFNTQVISEFRDNAGRVGGMFEGAKMLLLHHTGAKSGAERVAPLVYLPDGDHYVIFASKGGAPENPAWYHNIKAKPDAKIEVGEETVEVEVQEAQGDERERLYAAQVAVMPQFAEYAEKTDRLIPVLVLSPKG